MPAISQKMTAIDKIQAKLLKERNLSPAPKIYTCMYYIGTIPTHIFTCYSLYMCAYVWMCLYILYIIYVTHYDSIVVIFEIINTIYDLIPINYKMCMW